MGTLYDVEAARTSIEKKMKAGHNQGTGLDYIPWEDVRPLSNMSRLQRPPGLKTGREQKFPRDDEYYYFRVLDLAPQVLDIREYFAVTEIEETVAIAEQLGLKHPTIPKTNVPIPILITYFVTIDNGAVPRFEAHLFRNKNTLEHRNTLEEIEILYQFLNKHHIPLFVVTPKQITADVVWNIELLVKNYSLSDQNLRDTEIQQAAYILTNAVLNSTEPLRHICTNCDEQLGLNAGVSLCIAYHLIAHRKWQVDIAKKINTDEPLAIKV
jgi:hypothetical protein